MYIKCAAKMLREMLDITSPDIVLYSRYFALCFRDVLLM